MSDTSYHVSETAETQRMPSMQPEDTANKTTRRMPTVKPERVQKRLYFTFWWV